MDNFFLSEFHQRTKVLSGGANSFSKRSPHDVTVKSYRRFPVIQLPQLGVGDKRLALPLCSSAETSLENISSILSCGMTHSTYPIEAYVLVVEPFFSLEPGLYHYRRDNCTLEYIYDYDFSKALKHIAPVVEGKPVLAVFLTATFLSLSSHSNEHAYKNLLLEVGEIGGTMKEVAKSKGFDTLRLTEAYDDCIEKIINIDGFSEAMVSSLLLYKN